jgi:hypothetical protein
MSLSKEELLRQAVENAKKSNEILQKVIAMNEKDFDESVEESKKPEQKLLKG